MNYPGTNNQYKNRCFMAIGTGTTNATKAVIPYHIPKEARFISIWLRGHGGNGGSGATGSAGTSRRGGGGGGGGATSALICSTRTLPSTIYLMLPGAGTGTSVSQATISYIPTTDAPSSSHFILGATGGGNGTATGTAGSGGSATTNPNALGVVSFSSIAGVNGTASGNAASTTNSSYSGPFSVAAGGGGSTNASTPFAGGSIVTVALSNLSVPTNTVLVAGGANTGAAGANGFTNTDNYGMHGPNIQPLYTLPGAGGGAIDNGTGGAGGSGAPGCGGGGGGAGTTGGAGGLGGPAICMIEWW